MLVELPVTELELLNNVVAREIIEPTPGIQEPPPDPTLRVLDLLIGGVINGTDLSPVRDEVTRILSNQEDKSRIVMALVQTHDYHRINQLLQVRAIQENRLWSACRRGDISTTEALAFFKLASGEIEKIAGQLRAGNGGASVLDSAATVDKVDPASREGDRQLQATYAATTPHGREIIRKRLYDMKRDIVAKQENGDAKAP